MEFLERNNKFSSGEVRTEAEMWTASTEANLRGLHRASDVELVRLIKHPFIAVGARVEQHDFVAGRESLTSKFGVSGHRATKMNDRRCMPDDLFYRSLRIGIEVAKPEVALVRVVSQGVQTVSESVPCRFVAGNDKKNEKRSELLRAKSVTINFGSHQCRSDVVTGFGATALTEFLSIRCVASLSSVKERP